MSKKIKHKINNETLRIFEKNMGSDVDEVCDDVLLKVLKVSPKNAESLKKSWWKFKNIPPTNKEREILTLARNNDDPKNIVSMLKRSSVKNERDVYRFLMLLKNADPRLRKVNNKNNKSKIYGKKVTYLLYLELWRYDVSEYLYYFYPDLTKPMKMKLLEEILSFEDIDPYYLANLIKRWKLESEFTDNVLTKNDIPGLSGELNDYGALKFKNINNTMKEAYNNYGYDLLFFISSTQPSKFVKFMKDGKIDVMYQDVIENVSSSEDEENIENWVYDLFGYVPSL